MDKKTFEIAYKLKEGKKKSELAKKYGVTRGKVEWSLKYFNCSYNENFHYRNQIILGSILGDSYIQNRKNDIYVYRECHTLGEEEYLKWKFLMLDDFTFGNHIYYKNLNNDYSTAKEFCTKYEFSKEMKKYYYKSIEDVISEINIYGLLIFLLDDGWYSDHSKNGNFVISSGALTENQLKLIQEKFKKYGIETTLVGKRKDISISSEYNFILLSYLIKLFNGLLDIDIIQKKFGKVIDNFNKICYESMA